MADLAEAVKNAGVIGAGGAGFPTHVKIGGKTDTLIINGAECEPLIHVDRALLANEKAVLVSGLTALREHLGPKRAVLCLKKKNAELMADWSRALQPLGAAVFPLEDFYPAGDEQVLVFEVTGNVVPPGGIPPDVGTVVINVETLLNIGKAVTGQPVTEKYITVAGAVRRAGTFRVPVGIRCRDVIEAAGGITEDDCICLAGGPMMGKILADLDAPVSKATKALLILPARLHFVSKMLSTWGVTRKRAKSSCELCQMCTDLCPRYLLGHQLRPHRVMRYCNYIKDLAELPVEVFLCVECGVCEHFSCPVSISPRAVIQKVKARAREKGLAPARGGGYTAVKEMWDFRKVPYKRLVRRLGLEPYDVEPDYFGNQTLAPAEVRLPLRPPFGADRVPVVSEGQPVRRGDLVAEPPPGKLGSNIHASIDGRVVRISEHYITVGCEEKKNEQV